LSAFIRPSRWQRGLLHRLLNEIEADPEVGRYAPATRRMWGRLEALAEASQKGVCMGPFGQNRFDAR